jgi:hypothetical protein
MKYIIRITILLHAYKVQISRHKIQIGILCWLDVINQKAADTNSTSVITSEAATWNTNKPQINKQKLKKFIGDYTKRCHYKYFLSLYHQVTLKTLFLLVCSI